MVRVGLLRPLLLAFALACCAGAALADWNAGADERNRQRTMNQIRQNEADFNRRIDERARQFAQANRTSGNSPSTASGNRAASTSVNNPFAAVAGLGALLQRAPQPSEAPVVLTPQQVRTHVVADARGGSLASQLLAAKMYYSGYGGARDDAQAAQWFRSAAEQGDAEAQGAWGFMLKFGIGVGADAALASAWSRKAAQQGDARGQLDYGTSLLTGAGVAVDHRQGLSWVRKASDQDFAPAQLALAYIRRGADYGEPAAPAEAVRLFQAALQQEDSVLAHAMLGEMLLMGEGVKADAAAAARHLKTAADRDDAAAQTQYGFMLLEGTDVSPDVAQGLRLLQAAAGKGFRFAHYYLGLAYKDGIGVSADATQAVRWLRSAQAQGVVQASAELSPELLAKAAAR